MLNIFTFTVKLIMALCATYMYKAPRELSVSYLLFIFLDKIVYSVATIIIDRDYLPTLFIV